VRCEDRVAPEGDLTIDDGPAARTQPSAEAPDDGAAQFLRMRWEALTYLHWDVEPAAVQALLPEGLRPDVIDGRAWVGLIPFRMAGIRLHGPDIPLPSSTFAETNVRTYVIGPDGDRGVHFHSLDVPALAPTLVARLGFRLPYCFSTMRISQRGERIGYLARRRWPAAGGRDGAASSRVIVRVGAPVAAAETTEIDVRLSAQWALYAASRSGAILKVDVRHAPWRLREAVVEVLEDELVGLAGYDLGGRAPVHVRHADPVDVATGAPRRVG
jgi:uncharacterized protein YqjF (DUF2071 family)